MNTPAQQDPDKYTSSSNDSALSTGGGINGTRVAIGVAMLVGGIALSAAGTGRVFIGLLVGGVISIVSGLAGK